MATQIERWQELKRRMNDAPKVWATFYLDEEGFQEVGNLYESREAAQEEVDWHVRRGKKGRHIPTLGEFPVASLELARERWQEARER